MTLWSTSMFIKSTVLRVIFSTLFLVYWNAVSWHKRNCFNRGKISWFNLVCDNCGSSVDHHFPKRFLNLFNDQYVVFKVLNGSVITLDMHTPSDGLGTILIKQLGKNTVWTKKGLDTIIRVSGKLGTSCILVMTIFIAFSPLFRPPYRIWDFDKVLLTVKLAHARIYSRFHARECLQ